MSLEEKIIRFLSEKFNFLKDKICLVRPRRVSAEADNSNFKEVFTCAVKEMGFSILCAITGLDEGENLSFIYHLAQENGIVLSLKASVPKDNPVLETVTAYFPSAECYERELVDLLGVEVRGLPGGNRYPLTDDWPADEHPLRKDWKSKQA